MIPPKQLKPCPFCGSDHIQYTIVFMGDGYKYRAVECRECGASVPGNYSMEGDQAKWDWNERAERTCNIIDKPVKLSQLQTAHHKTCSACEYEFGVAIEETIPFNYTKDVDIPNYCPHCGAKVAKQTDACAVGAESRPR